MTCGTCAALQGNSCAYCNAAHVCLHVGKPRLVSTVPTVCADLICAATIGYGGPSRVSYLQIFSVWQYCFNAVQPLRNYVKRYLSMSGTLRQSCGSSEEANCRLSRLK